MHIINLQSRKGVNWEFIEYILMRCNMNDYVIFSDSTTDLTAQMIQELNIGIIPLSFFMEEKQYKNFPDHSSMAIKDFYNKLRGGEMASTAQINPTAFEEVFAPILESGKDILYIVFSSGLSGTYQSACIAAQTLNERFTNNEIKVVDSLAASMGEGLLVYFAAKQKEQGKTLTEVYDWVVENRNNIAHWFTVDDLHHLKRGGRVSAAAAVIGSALGIKPVLHVDDEGHLIPQKKVRGRKSSLTALVDKLEETIKDRKNQTIFISHGDSLEDAEAVKEMIKKKLPDSKIYINFIGPVIGAHSGPGTIALFFLATSK